MLITISRQYAAGGNAVAQRVADALGWRLVDNALVERVAERAGLPLEEVALHAERVPSFVERFARLASIGTPELFLPAPSPVEDFEEERLAKITRGLVEDLAKEGRMVILGHAAAAVLARDEGTLRVRIVAPVEVRIQAAIDRLGVPAKDARKHLADTDRNRHRYHREFYGRDWDDPVNYHMVLNTATLGFDGATSVITSRVRDLGWLAS